MTDVDTCAPCLRHAGLCDRHAKSVLPQLAQPAWIRLIGESVIEQKKRQTKRQRSAPVSAQQRAWKQRRERTQAVKRMKRRGALGLILSALIA